MFFFWMGNFWIFHSLNHFFSLKILQKQVNRLDLTCRCLLTSCSVVSDSLRPHGLYSPWNSPDQNTGMGSRSLLQGIFPTQRLNPSLPRCRWILCQLSHQGSPRILEWVAYLFSRGSSWPGSLNQGLLHCRWILYQLSYQLYLWTLNFEFHVVLMCYMFFFWMGNFWIFHSLNHFFSLKSLQKQVNRLDLTCRCLLTPALKIRAWDSPTYLGTLV